VPFVRFTVLACLATLFCSALTAQSVYPLRPNDPHAVYLTSQEFGARADGITDDADALQHAIDRVQETTHHGVVFIPEGRYRLGKTVHVWAGIRLIGFGAKRPVFILGRGTPGFQKGASHYLLWFTDERTPDGEPIADASEFTFYSGVMNIDFQLGEGNPAAVAIRFNVAQHGIIAHANFHLSSARAAIEAVGNQADGLAVTPEGCLVNHIVLKHDVLDHRPRAAVPIGLKARIRADGVQLRGDDGAILHRQIIRGQKHSGVLGVLDRQPDQFDERMLELDQGLVLIRGSVPAERGAIDDRSAVRSVYDYLRTRCAPGLCDDVLMICSRADVDGETGPRPGHGSGNRSQRRRR